MQRRTFLKWATNGRGALFGLVLGIPAVAYLIDPRNRAAGAGDFKKVARLRDLEVGRPTEVVIRETRRDAWTLRPDEVVGRVWLVKGEGKDKVEAFTSICPHLGCSVNFDRANQQFVCPCHGGTFALNGERTGGHTNPAPRGMDALEWKFEDPNNPDVILVKYQDYYQGRETKELKK